MAVDALDEVGAPSKSIPENFWEVGVYGKKLEKSLWGVLPRDHGQPGPFLITETPKIQKIRVWKLRIRLDWSSKIDQGWTLNDSKTVWALGN